jgi:hypothetical protein
MRVARPRFSYSCHTAPHPAPRWQEDGLRPVRGTLEELDAVARDPAAPREAEDGAGRSFRLLPIQEHPGKERVWRPVCLQVGKREAFGPSRRHEDTHTHEAPRARCALDHEKVGAEVPIRRPEVLRRRDDEAGREIGVLLQGSRLEARPCCDGLRVELRQGTEPGRMGRRRGGHIRVRSRHDAHRFHISCCGRLAHLIVNEQGPGVPIPHAAGRVPPIRPGRVAPTGRARASVATSEWSSRRVTIFAGSRPSAPHRSCHLTLLDGDQMAPLTASCSGAMVRTPRQSRIRRASTETSHRIAMTDRLTRAGARPPCD